MSGQRVGRIATMALAAGLLACAAWGQAATSGSRSGVRLYRIAGTLTDSVSGSPIGGATMTLLTTPEQRSLQVTETDELGRFVFATVAAGKYALMAARRGYLTEDFDEHENYSSAIVTGEGQDTEHVPFRLDPGAVLRGTITDEAGEPAANAKVVIRMWSRYGGLGAHLEPPITEMVDDRGEFETWNLRPGSYVAAVEATPWYAVHPLKSELAAAASSEEREAMASLDVAYPMAYFDSVEDEGAASPVKIAPGSSTEMNFTLRKMPAAHLTVRMPESKNEFQPPPTVQSMFFGELLPPDAVGQRIEQGGAVRYEYAVAPGHYRVTGGSPVRSVDVDVNGDREVDLEAGEQAVETSFKVRMADGSPLDKTLQMHLMGGSAMERNVAAGVSEQGEARFFALPPGDWIAVPVANNMELAVVAQESGGKSKADSRINLSRMQGTVTLVLAQAKTSIEGFAQKDGHGQAGIMIVLVPRNPAANIAEFRRDQSDSDGSFLLQNVIPGEYTVVAIEDGWELDWMKPGTIEKYLAGGERVTVRAGDAATLRLSAPVKVQKR